MPYANTRHLTGWCIEAHDLAASKLAAFREKDRGFVRLLLVERLIDRHLLLTRVAVLPVAEEHRARLRIWIEAV